MYAYLDPGSGDTGTQIGAVVVILIAVVILLALIGGVVYFAVRRAQRAGAKDGG